MAFALRLYKDVLHPQAAGVALDAHPARALYVATGALRVTTDSTSAALSENSAWHHTGWSRLHGATKPATVLRWELDADGARAARLAGGHCASELLLDAPITLDSEAPYLLRCDRVDFPAGGEALTHTHCGGGVRCLLFGGIDIHTKDAVHRYLPLEPWFEAGPDPVYAKASPAVDTAFARVMILPRDLAGKSSITYVNAEDLAKPKSQRYQVFIDAPIELPA